jgi:hypothetical protein
VFLYIISGTETRIFGKLLVPVRINGIEMVPVVGIRMAKATLTWRILINYFPKSRFLLAIFES